MTITPGVNQESVAEQSFGLLLGLTRRIVINSISIAAGGWERTLPIPLRGKTMGLIGLGRIGQAMVPKAKAFGMHVVAYDPYMKNSPFGPDVPLVSLDEVMKISDVISLHIPISLDTKELIRSETIQQMKRGVRSGHVGGACLDVTNPEPPLAENPLRRFENVIISPHLGGIDSKSMAAMADMASWCVVEQLAGRNPEGCVVS